VSPVLQGPGSPHFADARARVEQRRDDRQDQTDDQQRRRRHRFFAAAFRAATAFVEANGCSFDMPQQRHAIELLARAVVVLESASVRHALAVQLTDQLIDVRHSSFALDPDSAGIHVELRSLGSLAPDALGATYVRLARPGP